MQGERQPHHHALGAHLGRRRAGPRPSAGWTGGPPRPAASRWSSSPRSRSERLVVQRQHALSHQAARAASIAARAAAMASGSFSGSRPAGLRHRVAAPRRRRSSRSPGLDAPRDQGRATLATRWTRPSRARQHDDRIAEAARRSAKSEQRLLVRCGDRFGEHLGAVDGLARSTSMSSARVHEVGRAVCLLELLGLGLKQERTASTTWSGRVPRRASAIWCSSASRRRGRKIHLGPVIASMHGRSPRRPPR